MKNRNVTIHSIKDSAHAEPINKGVMCANQMKCKVEEYEVWEDVNSTAMATTHGIRYQKEKGLISSKARKIHSFLASTPEEASAIYHLRMGFEPYIPMGNAKICPKGCGSYFYPEGSGICPNCGKLC